MRHPLVQDFDCDNAYQALNAWIQLRFPELTQQDGFEGRFKSAASSIYDAQNRLAGALGLQMIEHSMHLTAQQRADQAENIYKSGDISDKRGARNAAMRVLDAKPPPTQWRRKLQRLKSIPSKLLPTVIDRSAREALHLGALRAGILEESGSRWLHYLQDNPDHLEIAIETALMDPMLRGDVGRPDEDYYSDFARDIVTACHALTDHWLSHKIAFKADRRSETSSEDGDQIVSPDVLLLQSLLLPFGDTPSPDKASHLIRNARLKTT